MAQQSRTIYNSETHVQTLNPRPRAGCLGRSVLETTCAHMTESWRLPVEPHAEERRLLHNPRLANQFVLMFFQSCTRAHWEQVNVCRLCMSNHAVSPKKATKNVCLRI